MSSEVVAGSKAGCERTAGLTTGVRGLAGGGTGEEDRVLLTSSATGVCRDEEVNGSTGESEVVEGLCGGLMVRGMNVEMSVCAPIGFNYDVWCEDDVMRIQH